MRFQRIFIYFLRLFSLVASVLVTLSCQHTVKRLHYDRMTSPSMQRTMDYSLYLPPDWQPTESLPLVVFLHGGGDAPSSFDHAGIGLQLDEAIRDERLPRVIIVLPEGNVGLWANWYDGTYRYEDWVVDDLMTQIAQRYHTLPCPQGCHLMGISMGGYGSLRFVLHHPHRFASVTIISGPILDTDGMIAFAKNPWWRFLLKTRRVFGPGDDRALIEREDPFLRWTQPSDLNGMRLFLAWGDADRDGIIRGNETFVRHLRAHGIPHQFLVFHGPHKWTAWTPVVMEALECQLRPTHRQLVP